MEEEKKVDPLPIIEEEKSILEQSRVSIKTRKKKKKRRLSQSVVISESIEPDPKPVLSQVPEEPVEAEEEKEPEPV